MVAVVLSKSDDPQQRKVFYSNCEIVDQEVSNPVSATDTVLSDKYRCSQ